MSSKSVLPWWILAVIASVLVVTFVVGIYIVFGLAIYQLAGEDDFLKWPMDKWGLFGDSFNALTSLFSGLAFAFFVIALFLQMRELALQRKDLEDTQKIMKHQQMALEAQGEALARQVFENGFYNLLAAYQRFVETLSVQRERTYEGRRAISSLVEFLEFESKTNPGSVGIAKFVVEHARLSAPLWESQIALLKMINESTVSGKQDYANVLKSQLSHAELVIFWAYCRLQGDAHAIATKFELFRGIEKHIPDSLRKAYEIEVINECQE